ncbi:MAG: FAD-dependent oxidoreductase [Candidatus Melainabacteria bacterium]|nr:FAD-dependent oxidoreductase [Candidatus Melainabacteria bacterium]
MEKTVIVGAGVAGLTIAYKLALAGKEVVVLEKENTLGGLTRSFRYNEFIFDIGPHRFHTDDKEVEELVREILASDIQIIERSSGVWMFGEYFDWPLKRAALLRLPFGIMIKAFFDLLSRKKQKSESFEDYIISRYGKTLYRIFFKPYTEKFLRYDCSQIHSDWAQAGIDRAVIDKRVKMDSLFNVIRSTLLPKPVNTKFIYPASGGIDVFSNKLGKKILSNKGRIETKAEITKITHSDNKITSIEYNGNKINTDMVIWTAPIPEITNLLKMQNPKMEYLSLVSCNFMIDASTRTKYQWCYYGGNDISFNRVSIPTLFNDKMAPAGKSGICVELACMQNDAIWKNPEHLRTIIENDLVKTGLVKRFNEIIDVKFERVLNTYPIYTMEYKERLNNVMSALSKIKNLKMLGRTGTFWYNNMDHSIKMALDMARNILESGKDKTKREFYEG